MKKKVSLLISFVLFFSSILPTISLAESSREDAILEEIQEELELLEKNINNMEEEETNLETWIDESIEQSESIKNIENEIEISNYSRFNGIGNKIGNIKDFINRQYKLKTQYITNVKNTYNQSKVIKEDLILMTKEINSVFNDENKKLEEEDFYLILTQLKTINIELKNSNYKATSILKKSREYIGLVIRLDLKNATNIFEEIVYLQIDRLNMLNNIKDHIATINSILLY